MLTKSPTNLPKFSCEKCNYNTNNKKDYGKHLLTSKHLKLTSVNQNTGIININSPTHFICNNCNKIYTSRVGLWKHNKLCKYIDIKHINNTHILQKEDNEPSDKQLIMMLIKENAKLMKDNSEFKQMVIDQQHLVSEQQTIMMEVLKNGTNNNITNSHNKTFNLQFFLNETCKDAMNIMDFVESIKLQLTDLEKVGEIGYVDGISNIIVKNLKALDVTQRQLHCTDKKREVLYLKDEDKWEKQGEDNTKLRKVIRKVTSKNIGLISQYKEKHPDCSQSDSRYSDEYSHILIESMGGSGDNYTEKEAKIIQNISKEVVVDK